MRLSKQVFPLDYGHDYWRKNFGFLKNYIMQSLGSPIVRIELTESMLSQAIHDSISQYFKYRDGQGDLFFEELPVDGNNEVELPTHIIVSLIRDVVFTESSNAFGFINPIDEGVVATYPLKSFMNMNGGIFDLGQYFMARQNLEDANAITGRKKHWEIINGKIKVFPSRITSDQRNIGVLYGKMHDPDELESDDWIRAYSVAASKIMLGNIRRKFSGYAAAGGSATSDGDNLIQEGKTEQAELIAAAKEARPALGWFQE